MVTSDLEEVWEPDPQPSNPQSPAKPPVTLSLPPTIEARASLNALGREARGVQAVAPGRRVSTEECQLDPSFPPATTSSCKGLTCGLVRSHPGGKSSTGMSISSLLQLGELLDKAVDVVPATLC